MIQINVPPSVDNYVPRRCAWVVRDIKPYRTLPLGRVRAILQRTPRSGPVQTRWPRAALFIAAVLFAAATAHAHDIANGQGIAQVWCSNCHRVDPLEQGTARDATPTFLTIARKKSTTQASLAAFLRTRHGGMPDLTLSRKEIEDVSAYILSLRSLP